MVYDIKDLDKDLKNDILKPIYFFYGEEKYDIERSVSKIKSKFSNLQTGVNFLIFNSNNIDELEAFCNTFSFLGGKKLAVIKDSGLKFDIDMLSKSTDQDMIAIVIEDKVDKRTVDYKKILNVSATIEFEKMKSSDAINYIMATLKMYKIEVPREVASYMETVCGDDKNTLINEFQKLVSYLKSGDKLTIELVDYICAKTMQGKIFEMLDKIMEKDKKDAIEMLEQLIMLKEPVIKISIMLYKQIKQLYLIKLARVAGRSEGIAKDLGIHPFVYRKLLENSNKYDIDSLEKIIAMFNEYDNKSKFGQMDFEIGLKQIICLM